MLEKYVCLPSFTKTKFKEAVLAALNAVNCNHISKDPFANFNSAVPLEERLEHKRNWHRGLILKPTS